MVVNKNREMRNRLHEILLAGLMILQIVSCDSQFAHAWESLLFSLGAKTVGFRTASLTCGVGVAF